MHKAEILTKDILHNNTSYTPLRTDISLLDNRSISTSALKHRVIVDAEQKSASRSGEGLLIFTVYTDRDAAYFNEIKMILDTLRLQGLNISCQFSTIYMGDRNTYDRDYIESAHLILFLASRAFVSTEYCYSDRISCAVNRTNADNCSVFPIILEACSWDQTPLKGLYPLPKGGIPIDRWPRSGDAFLDIEIHLRNALRELEGRL